MEEYEGFEIDREALLRIMVESTNKALESKSWNDAADHIISTMPTWLKRIEEK